MFCLRQHPAFEVLGLLYGVSESSAYALYRNWVSVLRLELPCSWLEAVNETRGDNTEAVARRHRHKVESPNLED